jgi:hypothetical protein
MIFDEDGFRGAAAEGFDAYGTSAGEDIHEARAYDTGAQNVEERFAEAIARGTKGKAFEAFQDAAAIFTGDDAHGSTIPEVDDRPQEENPREK